MKYFIHYLLKSRHPGPRLLRQHELLLAHFLHRFRGNIDKGAGDNRKNFNPGACF